jgi:UDP-2,3-diacylglucosamine pyrophosphatase LpxH
MLTPPELFVISDLHIGGALPDPTEGTGARGFRMNTHMAELAAFVRELAQRGRRLGRRLELVINGDIVDFLAERSPGDGAHRAFVGDPASAADVFDVIVHRDLDFFNALGELLAAGGDLTLLLGNHDIELSLPQVRQRVRAALGLHRGAVAKGGADQGLPTTGGEFKFVYDGEAYVVGDVLIEHGNRYDGWNVVDHDRLRRHRSESSRLLPISEDARFTPPAGSTLVERVMNPIKRAYPFIDLLKPENDAAVPLLLALEPSLADAARAIEFLRLRSAAEKHETRAPGRPARPGNIAGAGQAPGADAALRALLSARLGPQDAQDLLELTSRARATEAAASRNIAAGALSRAFSFMQLRTSSELEDRLRLMLPALRALRHDTAFTRGVEGEASYLNAAKRLAGGGFAAIVFGHTHLAKQLSLPGGRCTYLNTGTWADLIQVPDAIVNGPPESALASLRVFAESLRKGSLADYVHFSPTYAHIRFDEQGRARSAQLLDYTAGCLEPA